MARKGSTTRQVESTRLDEEVGHLDADSLSTDEQILSNRGGDITRIDDDGLWVWWHESRAAHSNGKTFVGYVDSGEDLLVASYDHSDGTVTETVVASGGGYQDDHANPVLRVLSDGRILVIYTEHIGPDIRYRISDTAGDISSLGSETVVNPASGNNYTYPTFVEFSDGTWRIYGRWEHNGSTRYNYVESTDQGSTWSDSQSLFGSPYYYVKIRPDPNGDDLHIAAFSHQNAETFYQGVYYFRYDKSAGTFSDASGSTVFTDSDTPEGLQNYDMTASDLDPDTERIHGWDLRVADDGTPSIVYLHYRGPNDATYRHTTWTGSQWEDNAMCPAGGRITELTQPHYVAGVCLDSTDPTTAYVARGGDDSIIQRWATTDNGQSWSVTDLYGGDGLNIRPISPDNHHDDLKVIWAQGRYRTIQQGGYLTRVLGSNGSPTNFSGFASQDSSGGTKAKIWQDGPQTVAGDGSDVRVLFGQTAFDVTGAESVPDDEGGVIPNYRETHHVSATVRLNNFSASGTATAVVRTGSGSPLLDLGDKNVTSGDDVTWSGSCEALLNKGEEVYLTVSQDTGSSCDIRDQEYATNLSVVANS